MPEIRHVLIAGAGHSGGTLAALLRQGGYTGALTLVGDEPIVPYQRPPLSKGYLSGSTTAEELKLRTEQYHLDQSIALRLGDRIAAIDLGGKLVRLDGGGTLGYDVLVLATGSRARALPVPGAGLEGLAELRSLADADRLKPLLTPGRRLVMVGGGYIGLELAASAAALGASVTVVEREERILPRVASTPLSAFFEAEHRARGVEIVTNARVSAFAGDGAGRLEAVVLADGRVLACDAALIGIGGVPNDEVARAAGLQCDGGIVVDLRGRTSDPFVFAIGDVTKRPLPLYGGRMFRLESVPNALEQAKQVAAEILGKPPPAPEVPWFWSDQFDVKLQIAGLPFDIDSVVVRGQPETRKFSVCMLSAGRLACIESVNSPGDFMGGKALIGRRIAVSEAALGDPTVPMKTLLAGAAAR